MVGQHLSGGAEQPPERFDPELIEVSPGSQVDLGDHVVAVILIALAPDEGVHPGAGGLVTAPEGRLWGFGVHV